MQAKTPVKLSGFFVVISFQRLLTKGDKIIDVNGHNLSIYL